MLHQPPASVSTVAPRIFKSIREDQLAAGNVDIIRLESFLKAIGLPGAMFAVLVMIIVHVIALAGVNTPPVPMVIRLKIARRYLHLLDDSIG
jgi:hypothetical protein